MKIGLVPDHLLGWQGGRDFFAMLYDSLSMVFEPPEEIRILSIAKRDALPWRVARVAKHMITQFPPDMDWVKKEFARPTRLHDIAAVVGRKVDVKILSELHANGFANGYAPDVIGPWFGFKPRELDVPCVGYIPDCQHSRIPNYFSEEEIVWRDTLFAAMLHELPVVIVHSLDVKNDLIRYFPHVSGEIISLPFAACPMPEWFDGNDAERRKKYHLPSKYFLCSNQFWQHKNHSLIIEALALARADGRPISIVFTGAMEDYRAPAYVSELMSQVHGRGVATDCLFLGLVPKQDQIAVMKSAIAVVQPTQFEGNPGGLAVWDAISIGRPVIVSDIPVNREIENYVDAFFSPFDPASLLHAMRRIENAPDQQKVPAVLLAEGRERRRHCGEVIMYAFATARKISVHDNK